MNKTTQLSKKYAIFALGTILAGCITQSVHTYSYKADVQKEEVTVVITKKDARIALSSTLIAVGFLQLFRNANIIKRVALGSLLAGIGTSGLLGKEKTLTVLGLLRDAAISGSESAVIIASDAFEYLSGAASSVINSWSSEDEEKGNE
jgi:hypothetical protein